MHKITQERHVNCLEQYVRFTIAIPFCLLLCSCSKQKAIQEPLFKELSATDTNVTFANRVIQSGENNVMNYPYYFNGGGVATGDINNDGRADIYFVGNQSPNALYLNKGDFVFDDITEKAGVAASDGWKTGVTMADVNQDGWLDIYVCRSAMGDSLLRQNLLFINNKDLTFTERAVEYGVADNAYSTQAAFFDYDRDGDLDLFVLNHSLPQYAGFNRLLVKHKKEKSSKFGSKLYRNTDGKFTDVTDGAGLISNVLSFGLGIAVSDINGDGWLDLYVSNDFNEEDYLYTNNRNGTFTNTLPMVMDHVSLFSMGSDAADINNDGRPDIITLDMLPQTNERIKLSSGDDNYDKYRLLVEAGFHPQFSRNMLQLNSDDGSFAEIGQYAGISNTDWSWSVLLADFDGDGFKDAYITNGYEKDYTNMQFLKYAVDEQLKARQTGVAPSVEAILTNMPSIAGEAHFFRNNRDLTFKEMSSTWSANRGYKANGAAYADLDNDGDLDLIANVMNAPAVIHRNQSVEKFNKKFITIDLQKLGKGNIIGTKVEVYQKDSVQYFEFSPTRGYQSAMHVPISIGQPSKIDSLIITWPNGKSIVSKQIDKMVFTNVAKTKATGGPTPKKVPLFSEVQLPSWKHLSAPINDFKRQVLLPRMYSYSGPAIATGDINSDGLDDFYVGGAKDQAGAMFIQHKNGVFAEVACADFILDKGAQDEAAAFVDVDNDGDLDLYVVSGGYMFDQKDAHLQDRLYINSGSDKFNRAKDALPIEFQAGGTVSAIDVNQDGFLDLFVGNRIVPGRYPETPASALLINNGKGKFSDNIAELAPELHYFGMVTDAATVDLNKDGVMDLIVVGEWTNLGVFINENQKLTNRSGQYLKHPMQGWWNCLAADDFDKDGDVDLLIGNYGLNSQFKVSEKFPASMTFKDFNADGKVDPFFSYYFGEQSYPYASRDEASGQVSFLQKRFSDYTSYANAKLEDIFTQEELKDSKRLLATNFETVYLENKQGHFLKRSLPMEVQFSPVYSILPIDVDNDGDKDVLLGGNETYTRVRIGQLKASKKLVLLNDGRGNFRSTTRSESGISISGDVRSLKLLKASDQQHVLVGLLNEKLRAFLINTQGQKQ